jgi:hypothetical protein
MGLILDIVTVAPPSPGLTNLRPVGVITTYEITINFQMYLICMNESQNHSILCHCEVATPSFFISSSPPPTETHGRMARGGHGLPKLSLWPAMPNPSTPCALRPPAGRAACGRLLLLCQRGKGFGNPEPYTFETHDNCEKEKRPAAHSWCP